MIYGTHGTILLVKPTMDRSETPERPVTDAEYEQFPERIRQHFDGIRSGLQDTASDDQ